MDGMNEVLKNLERKQKEILSNNEKAMLQGAMIGEANVKQRWSNRLATGRGFQTRTGTLVRSIGSISKSSKDKNTAYVVSDPKEFAKAANTSGVYYAHAVEHMLSGKYAFMLPGVMEVMGRIWDKIKDVSKGRGAI